MESDLCVRCLQESEFQKWDRLVQASSQGTIYHESVWLNLVRKNMPDQDINIYGCFSGNELVAGCVLRKKRKFAFSYATKPWASFYNGLLVNDASQICEEVIAGALCRHLRRKFDTVQLVQAPPQRHFSIKGGLCRYPARHTLVFRTDSRAKMWQKISAHARNAVRRAARAGVEVVESEDASIVRKLYWLSYQQQGVRMPFEREQFESVCCGLIQAGRAKLLVAVDESKSPCTALLLGFDKKRAYGMLSGTDHAFSRNGSGPLLWWEVFERMAPDYPEIDMVGEGTPAIRRFKMQFHPEAVAVTDMLTFRSHLAALCWDFGVRGKTYFGKHTLITKKEIK